MMLDVVRNNFGAQYLKNALEIVGSHKKVLGLIKAATSKAHTKRSAIEAVWDDFLTLLRMLKAWAKGEYTNVPWQTVLLGVFSVSYFVNPFDIIPDLIPLSGFVDDVTVLGLVISSIKTDIEAFRNWEESRNSAQAISEVSS